MDFQKITANYYSLWLGKENLLMHLPNDGCEIEFIHSKERNCLQYGYNQQFDLYAMIHPHKIVVSYGDKVLPKIEEIKSQITPTDSIHTIKLKLSQIFSANLNHHIKYCFNHIPEIQLKSRPLVSDDYPLYRNFFISNNPGCKNASWLQDYFMEMVQDNLCWGVFENNLLVSCSDAPGMPYMQEQVQEIGINTLSDYRKNGYAAHACIGMASALIDRRKCPQWSTDIDNIPSQKLAEKVGFVKFADLLTISL